MILILKHLRKFLNSLKRQYSRKRLKINYDLLLFIISIEQVKLTEGRQ